MLQIFFICFYFVDLIFSNGECVLNHSHSSLSKVLVYFGGQGGVELSTFQEFLFLTPTPPASKSSFIQCLFRLSSCT
jgi:hypothetical protein